MRFPVYVGFKQLRNGRISVGLIENPDFLQLEVTEYDSGRRPIERETRPTAFPASRVDNDAEISAFLNAAMQTVEKLRAHSYLSSIAGTATFAAASGLAAISRPLGLDVPAEPQYIMNFSAHVTPANKISASRLAELLFHGKAEAVTPMLRHVDDAGNAFQMRIYGKGDDAHFAWFNNVGEPMSYTVDEIHGDPEVEIFRFQHHQAMVDELAGQDESPAPGM